MKATLSGTALQNRYPALWRIPLSLNCLRLFSVLSNSINRIAGCLLPILSTSVSAPNPSRSRSFVSTTEPSTDVSFAIMSAYVMISFSRAFPDSSARRSQSLKR